MITEMTMITEMLMILTSSAPAEKLMKLAVAIANDRLDMVVIIGTFLHVVDRYSGHTGGRGRSGHN